MIGMTHFTRMLAHPFFELKNTALTVQDTYSHSNAQRQYNGSIAGGAHLSRTFEAIRNCSFVATASLNDVPSSDEMPTFNGYINNKSHVE